MGERAIYYSGKAESLLSGIIKDLNKNDDEKI